MEWKFPMKPIKADISILDRIPYDNYIMQPKYDGFRIIISNTDKIRCYTRLKKPMEIPDHLHEELRSLCLPNGIVLDGEIWNHDKRGAWVHDKADVCSITLWDVMSGKGSERELTDRYGLLSSLIGEKEHIKVVDNHIFNSFNLEKLRQDSLDHRLVSKSKTGYIHGVVIKRKQSPRRDHVNRSIEHPDWIKVLFI